MKREEKILVTAALPYSNGRLHVGHIAGAYLPADICVRFKRLCGKNVRFICGSDDHGVAIMLSAAKEGKSPAEISRFYNAKQKRDFLGLNINFDIYGATSTNPYHTKVSQEMFLRLHEKGYFEKKKTKQFYDAARNVFLPDRFVKGTCGYCNTPDQHGDQCENCGKVLDIDTLHGARSVISGEPAEIKETVHWFLDLSRFEKQVSTWIESSTLREQTKSYLRGLLSTGLVKRSMTRDIDWGIPVPLSDPDAKNKVLYVWFDAPIGYISNTLQVCQEKEGDAERYTEWWKSGETKIYHFIGEDNTIFHCVIWIAMLSAEGTYSLPSGVIVNQFLNIQFPDKEVEKISKSRGSAVWIEDYLEQGGDVDALRYYLTTIAPEKARTVFKSDDMTVRTNADLANTLGNLVHRLLSFTHKYVGPTVPKFDSSKLSELDKKFQNLSRKTYQETFELLDTFQFKAALEKIMDFARAANKYVDDKAPWTMRKSDMEGTCLTLALGLNAVKFLGVMLAPFIPSTSQKILSMLSLDPTQFQLSDALEPLVAGSKLNEPKILFEKVDTTLS